MTKHDVWMPIYVGDYLADTQRLTTEQHGAYVLLLLDYWRNGPPPADDAILCSITRLKPARFRKHQSTLLAFFKVIDGKLVNKRADAERIRAEQNANRNSDKARKAANARWNGVNGDASSNATSNAPECPSPSPSSVPTEQRGEVDFQKRVFDEGVSLLVRCGSSAGTARSFIGQCRKSASDELLSGLIADAIRLNITEPKGWLIAALSKADDDKDAMRRAIERNYPEKQAA